MSCSDYPTSATAKTFKLDAETTNEVVTISQDRTAPASDGKTKKTFWGIENDATLQRDNIEQIAEQQRENLESTFTAQFAYKRIGNISLYVGNSLPEVDKLNSYQYPDNSGEWYGPVQDQVFPITIPADPSIDDGWALVTSATQSNVNDGDSSLMGGAIHPENRSVSASVGDVVPNGVLFLNDAQGDRVFIIRGSEGATLGEITSLDFNLRTATINSTAYQLAESSGRVGKFALFSDGTFFYIWNFEDNVLVMRLADSTNYSDAHLTTLPIEARRNSHGFILTTETDNGSCDIDFRRNGGIDRAYWQYVGDGDVIQLLADTSAPESGASFDVKMRVPCSSSDPILFPSTFAKFEQGISFKKRTTGVNQFDFSAQNTNLTITDNGTGSTLGMLTSDGFKVGGKTFLTERFTYKGNGAYNYSGNFTSLTNGNTESFFLGNTSRITQGVIEINIVNAGNSSPKTKYAKFFISSSSNNGFTDIITEDLPSGFAVSLTEETGVGNRINFVNTSAGTLRVAYDINFTVATI